MRQLSIPRPGFEEEEHQCLGGRSTPSTNQSHAHTPVAYLDRPAQVRCWIKSWKPLRKFSIGSQWAEHRPWNTLFPIRLKRKTVPTTTILPSCSTSSKDMEKVDNFFFQLSLPLELRDSPNLISSPHWSQANSPHKSQTEPNMQIVTIKWHILYSHMTATKILFLNKKSRQ